MRHFEQQILGLLDEDCDESDVFAGPLLREQGQIHGDDGGDLRISASRLAIGEQGDQQARPRNLNAPDANAIVNDSVAVGMLGGRAFKSMSQRTN